MISDSLKENLIGIGIKKKIVRTTVSFKKDEFFKKRKKDENVVLFTAGSRDEEGVDLMIRLAKEEKNKLFIFALHNKFKQNMNKFNKVKKEIRGIKNIKLIGTRNDIPMIMNKVRVFIMPLKSKYIKMAVPISVLEAMASSCLVIGSSLEFNKEIIKDNFNGRVFEKDNFEDLLIKFRTIYENRRKLIQNATKTAREWPTWKEISKEQIKEYQKLLDPTIIKMKMSSSNLQSKRSRNFFRKSIRSIPTK